MQLFGEKISCCGCEACKEICPHNAIEMFQDEEGFFYPRIQEDKCTQCGLCARTCPINHEEDEIISEQITLGVKNKRKDLRMKESSGGFFSVLCNYVLSKNGVIYGVKFGCGNKSAEYTRVEEGYEVLFGSKYVQSKKGDTYRRIRRDITEGRIVLFVGTPCDNAGLKAFLDASECETDHIIFCDIVCHGVPSPLIFSQYIAFLEDIFCSRVKSFSFRDKSLSDWERSSIRADFYNGLIYDVPNVHDFYFVKFAQYLNLRSSCYQCSWKKEQRNGDFTLGDFWGIEKLDEQFADNLGVSLVLLNTPKSKIIFEELKTEIDYKQYDIKQAARYNDSLVRSRIECMRDRNRYFQELHSKGLEETIKDTWQLWRTVEYVFERFSDIRTMVEVSVNRNWILLGIKEKWTDTDTVGIYVNPLNDNCSIVWNYEQSSEQWNIDLLDAVKIDFIRMDLEGMEYFFLEEFQDKIIEDTPIILINLMRKWQNGGYIPNDALVFLKNDGYECYALGEEIKPTRIGAITEETEEKWFLFLPAENGLKEVAK